MDHELETVRLRLRVPAVEDVLGVCGVKMMSLHGRPVSNLLYRLAPELDTAGEDGIDLLSVSPERQ